jgi:hypothetical protein
MLSFSVNSETTSAHVCPIIAAALYTLLLFVVCVSTLQAPVYWLTYAFHPIFGPRSLTRALQFATSNISFVIVGIGECIVLVINYIPPFLVLPAVAVALGILVTDGKFLHRNDCL